jgi:hypothetical protein
MKGLCIGTGDWFWVARRAAAQMAKMTGLPCDVVDRVDSNLVHSSWHKLNLLRDYPGETLLIFDADIWCTQPWQPQDFAASGLAMVPEAGVPSIRLECALYGLQVGRYCNGGLLIVDARARDVFAAAKRLHPQYGLWMEQTAVNRCISDANFPLQLMPRSLNWLVDPGLSLAEIGATPATNLHFAGHKTTQRLHAIFDGLETR